MTLFGVLALVLLSACATTPQDSLNAAGPEAEKINDLFWPVFWIAVAVFVLVEGLLVVALVRFRHRRGSAVPKQVHGNSRLEVAWTIAPAILLAVIAVPTVGTIFALAQKPAGNVLEVTVTGHQWWWDVRYPSLNVVTANELHIPAGKPVYVSLTAADVIHSFWVPRLAGKQDLEPGKTNHLTIEADAPGVYLGQCAEFCGLSHANMRFRVIADTEAEFDAWVQQQRQPAPAPPPNALSIMQALGCGGCHTIDGVPGFSGTIGPNLTHFGGRSTFAGSILDNDAANLARWLADPQAVKPGNDMVLSRQLTDAEIQTLIAYLESLK